MSQIQETAEIVMVDDDQDEFYIASRYLEKSKLKCDLRTFSSGAAFLDYLKLVRAGESPFPALVLLDVRMPVMDGFDVLKRVRQDGAFQQRLTIMMFSHSNNEADMRRAFELGADRYQVKPGAGQEYIEFLDSLREYGDF